MIAVVPNVLRDAILRKLDAQIALCPAAAPDRDSLYKSLLAYYDEHGVIPDFSLVPKPPAALDAAANQQEPTA